MKNLDLSKYPLFFTFFTCFGGVFYGFCLGEFYQVLPFNETWNFHQAQKNLNYSLFNSLYPSGSFVGNLISGYTAYKYGRVKTIIFTDLITLIALLITLFCGYFEAFFIGRFFMGISTGVNFPMMLLLIREFVLDKDYLSCALFFQTSNTIGIFISNLFSLSGNWKISTGVSLLFPFLRMIIYYLYLMRNKIDSPIFMLNSQNDNDKEECLKTLEKIYPGVNIYNLKNNIENQETLLKKEFFMGSMFGPAYSAEFLFCVTILFLNQTSGIDQILSNSGILFKNYGTSMPIIFSLMNMLGGLSNIATVPHYKIHNFMRNFIGVTFAKGFKRFVIGTMLIIIILFIFGFFIDFTSESDHINVFIVLGCIYLLIFQFCLGCYPFLYIPVLLPDIGVFMVIFIHSIFGIIASLTFYFGNRNSNIYSITFRFCFVTSIIGIIIAVSIYAKYLRKKFLVVDCWDYLNNNNMEEIDPIVFQEKEKNRESSLELK